MKVDFYTKGLLLLIAVFLGIIALNSCTWVFLHIPQKGIVEK